MLTLYYSPGACSFGAHVVLEGSGEKYQATRVNLAGGEQHTPEYRKIHPMGRVPALRLDTGEVITENTAILPYLGKRFGLWPTDPVAEARALSWIGHLAVNVHPAHAHVARPERYATDKAVFPNIQEQGRKMYLGYMQEIDARLAGREWFGDSYSVIDPYALIFYAWGVRRELPMAELKNFTAFKDRIMQRPEVRRVVEDEKVKVQA